MLFQCSTAIKYTNSLFKLSMYRNTACLSWFSRLESRGYYNGIHYTKRLLLYSRLKVVSSYRISTSSIVDMFITWLCLTGNGNYRIHAFDCQDKPTCKRLPFDITFHPKKSLNLRFYLFIGHIKQF